MEELSANEKKMAEDSKEVIKDHLNKLQRLEELNKQMSKDVQQSNRDLERNMFCFFPSFFFLLFKHVFCWKKGIMWRVA